MAFSQMKNYIYYCIYEILLTFSKEFILTFLSRNVYGKYCSIGSDKIISIWKTR